MDKVAVILPVYKNDKVPYIKLSVDSILNQTYKKFHIYIGVDGPINSELEECLKLFEQDERIEVKWFKENRGLAIVLNALLDICFEKSFEYIARMDADDISISNRFEKQINFLKEHPDIDVVGGAITEIDEKGESRKKDIIYPLSPEDCRTFFAKRNPHAHPAVMFRKSFFEKIGHYYRPEYRQNQDTMLWLDGFSKGTNNANIPDIILKFRMTDALFKKRRNGFSFAKKQFKDRLLINRTLGYNFKADLFGFAMFCLLIAPTGIRKIAYRIFR